MSDADFREETAKWINAALRAYKKRTETSRSTGEDPPWILFTLKGSEYAVNAKYVSRTAVLYEMIPYEKAPACFPGVIWDRKGIVRLLDLRALMGLGTFMSGIVERGKGLPMFFIVGEDFRRGVIVDEIIMIKHVENESKIDYEQFIPFTCGRLRLDDGDETAPVINPEDFRFLELEGSTARLNWKGRIDIRMKAALLIKKSNKSMQEEETPVKET